MERKIGETFVYEGKKLQVKEIERVSCYGCFFDEQCVPLCKCKEVAGECEFENRADNKEVIFVEATEQPQEQAEQQTEQPHELNLCEILKDCPKGTKFYSYIFGEETYLEGITLHQGDPRPILIYGKYGKGQSFCLSRKGHPYADNYGECCIFPSKEMRDWSKFTAPWYKKKRFDPKTLNPFDKVLVRNISTDKWGCSLFSNINAGTVNKYHCVGLYYKCCVPYNDDTKHLVGTTDDAPDFYKYWED